jgi:hypothetical protein
MRADAVKRSSLTAMIKRAKEEGVFDEEEAKRGLSVARRIVEEEEAVEAVDEEGNVIAGEKIVVSDASLAPARGDDGNAQTDGRSTGTPLQESTTISPSHTILLPPRAPRQLLLDLKDLFTATPGPDPIALQIGGQTIPLPVTVDFSEELRKKVEEVIKRYDNA